MYNKNYSGVDNDFGKKTIDPYRRDRLFNENVKRKTNSNDFVSPLKISSNIVMNQNKTERFQNENLTVDRVSPIHYQYRTKFYDDGGYPVDNYNNRYDSQQNYNRENEINFNNSLKYINTEFNNNRQQNRGGSSNQRYNTPDNYNMNIYNNTQGNNKIIGSLQMKRENSDLDVDNGKYYLKNPCEYYRGEEIDDGYKHYNPEDNHYNGSRYGGYIYNYYLNAPMRGDKSEDWRFPPLYYYRPNYDSKRKIYTNYH